MLLSHCIYPSPLGNLYISATDESITGLSFYDPEKPVSSSETTQKCCEQLDEYFEGKRKTFDIKITQAGTDFQQKVWEKLMNVSYGKIATYQQLSKEIGNVKAIRAVGNANGKNNIAIIVPCHRIIGSNGNLVGYAGNIWRKSWLLKHEAKWTYGVQELFS